MSRILDTPVLERMLEPITRSLNADAAKKLVRLKADAKMQARVAKLARKCNEGALTPEELAEYDRYIAFADFIAIMQAQARLMLAKKTPMRKSVERLVQKRGIAACFHFEET